MTVMTIARAAVPVATGALLLLHPADPARADQLADLLPRWLTVHVGLLVMLPLLALIIRSLIRGLSGRAAKLAELSLVPGVVLYAVFESLVGTGTGLLVQHAARLPASEQAGAMALAEAWWQIPPLTAVIAALALTTWTTAVVAAGVALYRDGGSRPAGAGLIVSAVLFVAGHPGVTGAAAMAAMAVAVLLATPTRQPSTRSAVSWR